MRRALVVVAVAVGLVGGACTGDGTRDGVASSSTDATSNAEVGEDWIAADEHDALFTVDCAFSHRASDDPIVHPGHPGASHSHEFFGSAATDATSTGESLRGTATTCEDTEDTAAYWVPTLSIDGTPVDPTFVRAYYRAPTGSDVRDVQPPPLGLAMIAGDPTAGDDADGDVHAHHHADGSPVGEAGWGCGLRPRRLHVAPPTDCTDPSPLTLLLRFPDCWDGEHLDSDDHRSHVAPSIDGACPATHPVLMTELQVSVQWPVTGSEAGRATLSSGSVAGAHGDFLNGWEPDALAAHVDLCIKAKANCTIG